MSWPSQHVVGGAIFRRARFDVTCSPLAPSHKAWPDRNSQDSRLLVLEHMWNEAQVNRDWHALEGLVADQFINTEYDG